jgi:TPR repeat protein
VRVGAALGLGSLALVACVRSEEAGAVGTIEHPHGVSSYTSHTPLDAPDAQRAEEECDRGELTGCHALALHYFYRGEEPEAGPSDNTEAARIFKKACDGGYAPSCNGLGVMYAQGRGVREDKIEAARLYRTACDHGAGTACFHLGSALQRGDGIPKDPDAATRVFEQGCRTGDTVSCGRLDRMRGDAGS